MARILIIDDSAVMRRNLVYTLTHAGHEVVAQGMDGGQAYNLYKLHAPDLVTMDITMPEVNGIEAVKLIINDFPEAKIIMISALDQKQMVLEALKFGAKHYVIKPIDTEKLVAVINKVLGIVPQSPPKTKVNSVTEKVETLEESAEQEPESPFIIKNIDSVFHIILTKLLSMDNIGSLFQAAQGLLYVQPLEVKIDFGKIEALPENLLNKIAEIVNLILKAFGKVTVASKNEEFIRSVKDRHIKGLSELFGD